MRKSFKIACASALGLVMGFGCLTGCKDHDSATYTWDGLTAVTVAAGDAYNVMDGITVKDSKGTDVTSDVVVLTLDENEKELTELNVYDDYKEFNYNTAGVYTVYYMVKKGDKKEIKSREVTVTQQHNVANGDFTVTNANGFYNWNLDTPGGNAKLEKATENGKEKPKFEITGLGNAWYSLQYISKCNLKEGETYQVTVRAKSESGKSVAFGFENPSNGYSMMQGLTAYTLGNSYAEYVSYYTADADYIDAKAVLYFGYMLEEDTSKKYDLTIDDIDIKKVDKCNEVTFEGVENKTFYAESDELKAFKADPKKGVTAKNGTTDLTSRIKVMGQVSEKIMEGTRFTLAYVVENDNGPTAIAYRTINVRLQKEHPYSLVNGTFDESINYWTQDVNAQNPGKAKYEWEDGAAKITIETPSTDGWHIQFRQDVTMEKNVNYIIKIRAKASVNRSMTLELNSGSNNFAYQVGLTTEYKTTEIYYSSANDTTGFRFLLGGGGSNNNGSIIYIDSAEIVKDPDQTQYEGWQMKNPTFEQGMRHWGSEGATFTDGSDTTGKFVTATFADNTDAAWRIQLRQDGKQFKKGVKYKLIVKASASVERDVTFEINPTSGPSGQFKFTTEVKEFEKEFTFTEDIPGARVGLLLGGGAIKDTSVKIYRFEIVEVK